jgi:hypothetical protein
MATTYATIAELKPLVGIVASNTDSDTLLQRVLDAAARMFDGATRGAKEGAEAFSQANSSARRFDDYTGNGYVDIDDATAVTIVARDGQTLTVTTDYLLYPYNPGSGPYTRIVWTSNAGGFAGGSARYVGDVGRGAIEVTGTWGYCTAQNRPEAVKNAVLNLAAVMYKSQALTMEQVMNMVSNQNPVGIMARNVQDAVNEFRKGRRHRLG